MIDLSSVLRDLMNMRLSLQDSPDPQAEAGESEALRAVKNAIRAVIDTVKKSFHFG
jgi:hypothetical protein